MTEVSSKEFTTNQEKYLHLALDEEVIVQMGNNRLVIQNFEPDEPEMIFEPDEDFYRSVTIDELHRRVKQDIHQWYMERNENYSASRSTAIS